MTEMTEELHRPSAKRGLSTARAVLQVLAFLSEHPQGVHADEVAKVVGKSTSTAYYLLASLCEEGFAVHEGGVYLPVHRFDETARHGGRAGGRRPGPGGRRRRLFVRTHKRSYLGRARAPLDQDRGDPRPAGDAAHARTRHPHLRQRARARDGQGRPGGAAARGAPRYIAGGLRAFTARTITSPDTLAGRARRGPADRRRLRPRGVRRGLLLRRRADLRRGRRAGRPCSGCRPRRAHSTPSATSLPRLSATSPERRLRRSAERPPNPRRRPPERAEDTRCPRASRAFPTSCGNGGVSCFSGPSGRPFRHTPSRASLRRRSRRSCACRSGGRRASRRYIDPLSPPAPRSRRVRCRMSVPLKGGITQ